jgi:hypothetical protein
MELTLSYRAGWNKELPFQEALAASWAHDQEAGTTQVGPQRAEIAIRLNGTAVKDRISRGQQKLLASALLLAVAYLPHGACCRGVWLDCYLQLTGRPHGRLRVRSPGRYRFGSEQACLDNSSDALGQLAGHLGWGARPLVARAYGRRWRVP